MKSIVITKSHPCIQLAHIYEHLYMAALKRLLYSKGLLKLIDFTAWGITHDKGGIIEITCNLYSKKAIELMNDIHTLPIDLNGDMHDIPLSIMSISAEEPFGLKIHDKSALITELKSLESKKWQTGESIDTSSFEEQVYPVSLTSKKVRKPRTLQVELKTAGGVNAPLFNIIGHILLISAADQLALTEGYYVGISHGSATPLAVTKELLVAHPHRSLVDMRHDLKETANILRTAIQSFDPVRLSEELCLPSPHGMLYDTSELLEQTNIYVGSNDWPAIATTENTTQILENLSVSLTFNNEVLEEAL